MTTLALLTLAAATAALTRTAIRLLRQRDAAVLELGREQTHSAEVVALAGRSRFGYEAHITDVINDNSRLRERLAQAETNVEQLGYLVLAADSGRSLRAVRS